jgi:anti-anti-sigma regulatory factor
MLKITIIETSTEQRLVLEGKLTEPYISELESAWEKSRRSNCALRRVVDLRSATFIDKSGERILVHMKLDGAHFIACGVSTTHQLDRIGIACGADSGSKPHH